MKKAILALGCFFSCFITDAQQADSIIPDKTALRFNISADGSRYFQLSFLNQVWVRWNESNAGTTVYSRPEQSTFDIGLRRTRMQFYGPVTDRAFIYFQFGQNNYNRTVNYGGNRKVTAFIHDAVCEYRVSKRDQLKLGGGLTIMNGLSRFSQPSVSTIMTMDVPVFLQYSVDQIDQFDRRLAVYARGQTGKFDYRAYFADPFPVNSSGLVQQAGPRAGFIDPTVRTTAPRPFYQQFGSYLAYNFFENEPHTTPYLTGTHLGKRKIWNIAGGFVLQPGAMWRLQQRDGTQLNDTIIEDMLHFGFETYLDMPLNRETNSAVNCALGWYNMNYGKNYIRYNGQMNPATGTTATNVVAPGSFGNAFPMFGSGQVVFGQAGYLFPKKMLRKVKGQMMVYGSFQYADLQALDNRPMLVWNTGINWLIQGHSAKLTLDYQNRPTFFMHENKVESGLRKSCIVLQYQIAI